MMFFRASVACPSCPPYKRRSTSAEAVIPDDSTAGVSGRACQDDMEEGDANVSSTPLLCICAACKRVSAIGSITTPMDIIDLSMS